MHNSRLESDSKFLEITVLLYAERMWQAFYYYNFVWSNAIFKKFKSLSSLQFSVK